MRTMFCLALTIGILSLSAFAQQPTEALVQAGIDAYNSQNTAYFEKVLSPDVVWLDEDGHAIAGKDRVLRFVTRQITATPVRKMTVADIKVSSSGDVAWASFAYTIEGDGRLPLKGINTLVYKKSGSEWQLVQVHGALNTKAVIH